MDNLHRLFVARLGDDFFRGRSRAQRQSMGIYVGLLSCNARVGTREGRNGFQV